MKGNFLSVMALLLLACACGKKNEVPPEFIETKLHTHTPVVHDINSNCAGFYIGLPGSYDTDTRKHPLILSLHGWGALGGADGLSEVVAYSIGNLLQNGQFPKNVTSDGKNYSFIVVTPRFKAWPSATDVKQVLDYILANYRVDVSRIYISGASMGGAATFVYGATYPNVPAAVVSFSSAGVITNEQASAIAKAKLPVWAFHNEEDKVSPVANTRENVYLINLYDPVPSPKMTIWSESKFGGDNHDSWTQASDPAYKEDNMNIYEWMLRYHR